MRKINLLNLFLILLAVFGLREELNAQVGDVLWEENFDTFNEEIWTYEIGDGCPDLCGFGNDELQYYNDDNVSIGEVPGESGNNALIIEARRENMGTRAFTSGKIFTKNKVTIKYGMIEVRMYTPDLKTGLWPAAWLLGENIDEVGWPKCGEMDMMEQGHTLEARMKEGFPNADENSFTGANLIWYSPAACGEGNTDCAAMIAYDPGYNQPYVPSTPLNNRFVTYRTYWDSTTIRLTVIDKGIEYDLYTGPFTITAGEDAFQKPFYFILNMAVGGRFTDALENDQVSTPLPGKMYVDYVRVSQWNGKGTVTGVEPPVPGPVTSVDVSPGTIVLNPGKTKQLNETVYPTNALNKNISWSSSDNSVATVSTTGLVTAIANGNATITVTTEDGGFTATSVVDVLPPIEGVTRFGVFTDLTPVDTGLILGVDEEFYVWEKTFVGATINPLEGNGVIGLETAPELGWYGAGFASLKVLDLREYIQGNLIFSIKIPADIGFSVAVMDTSGNANWIDFPANETAYGLERNGDWAQASIPITELIGSDVSLEIMENLFAIVNMAGAPVTQFEMGLDDIYWQLGETPVTIIGDKSVAAYEAGVAYSTPEIEGATYTWTVPSDAVIVSGQGTPSIIVTFGLVSGPIGVQIDDPVNGIINYELSVNVQDPPAPDFTFEDFEENRNITYGRVTGTFNQTVTNPAAGEPNTSALVGEYVRNATELYDVVFMESDNIGDASDFVSDTRTLFVEVYTTAPIGTSIVLQLEDSELSTSGNYPIGRHSKYTANTTVQNAWETIEFAFDSQPSVAVGNKDVDNLVLLIDPATNTNHTVYFDNLRSINKNAPDNLAPIAKAGDDQSIELPASSVNLNGTASWDPDGDALTYSWLQTGGPNTASIVSGTSATTNVTGLIEGTYTFTLTVSDSLLSTPDEIVVIVTTDENHEPIANAGIDQLILLPTNSVILYGSGSSDPDGDEITYSWSQLSGPNEASITDNSSATTNATGLIEGIYTFSLTVSDGLLSSIDEVAVSVEVKVNKAPIAIAVEDQTIKLPLNSVNLNGTASYDPDGDALVYSWSQTSGPNTAVISPYVSATTSASGLIEGIYTFSLTVNDGYLSSSDSITIIVEPMDPGFIIPGILEAENFTDMFGVETQECSEGGLNVGWIETGDWMEYTITATEAMAYTVKYRIASTQADGTVTISINDSDVSTTNIPNTNGWQAWTTVMETVNIEAGTHVVRLTANVGGWNINWIDFSTDDGNDVVHIEAENYIDNNGVGTEPCSEGGGNAGWIDTGDWMVWNVYIPAAGDYTAEYRIASLNGGGTIQLEKAGGSPIYGTIGVPSTGGWQTWATVSHTVTLDAGQQQLAIYVPAGGYNINWIKLTKISELKNASITNVQEFEPISLIKAYPNPVIGSLTINLGSSSYNSVAIYDMAGRIVYDNKNVNGLKELIIDVNHLSKGLFTLLLKGNNSEKTLKIIKQ